MRCGLHVFHDFNGIRGKTIHRFASNDNLPSSRAKIRWDLLLKRGRREAYELIQNKPIGSFSKDEFRNASQLLQLFQRSRANDAKTAHTAIHLLERLAREIAAEKEEDPVVRKRLCNPMLLIRILAIYKNAAKSGEKVIPPIDVLFKLINVQEMIPSFQLDYVTIRIIVSVAILSTSASRAPLIVEQMINTILDTKTDRHVQPSLLRHLFNENMQAWAVSGVPDAKIKINELIERMQKNDIKLDTLSYNIMLRFYTSKKLYVQIENILQIMKIKKMKPTVENILRSILVYVALRRSDEAFELLEEVIKITTTKSDPTTLQMVFDSFQAIIISFRQILESDTPQIEKLHAIERVDRLFHIVDRTKFLISEKKNKLLNALMDLESRFGVLQKAITIFHSIKPKSVLSYNILLNGLARSDQTEAWGHAFALWKSMDESTQPRLRADMFSFSAILKCLSKSKLHDAGKKAIDLLDEMEQRYSAGEVHLKPSEIPYVLAIQTCLHVNDLSGAENVMYRLRDLKHIYPSPRHFCNFLMVLNKIGTSAAANFCEKLIDFMREKVQSGNPELRPNLQCYLILFSTYQRSTKELESIIVAERMARMFELAELDGFGLEEKVCSTVIFFLSRTNDQRFLEKAKDILKALEDNITNRPEQGLFNCVSGGWLQMGSNEKALEVILRGLSEFVEGRLKEAPNEKIFENIIASLVAKGDLVQATKTQLETLHFTNHAWPPLETSQRVLQILRSAWDKSNSPDRLLQMKELEQHMLILARGDHEIAGQSE